jgi:hypothetical protein
MADNPEPWRISREIPITVLLALTVQCGGIVWWAQGVTKDREADRHRIEVLESQRIGERISSLESQMLDMKASQMRVENNLQRLVERDAVRR